MHEVLNSPSSRNVVDEHCNRKLFHLYEAKELGLGRDFHTDPDPPVDVFVADAALTGNVLHDMIEARFLSLENEEEYAKASRPLYPEKCPDNTQHCWQYVRITYDAYKNTYPMENELPVWVSPEGILAVEYQWIEDEPKETSLFRDRGIIDRNLFCESNEQFKLSFGVDPRQSFQKGGIGRSIKEGGEVILTDTKSTGRKVTDRFWRTKLYNSVQFPIYANYMRSVTDKFHGLVLVDAIQHTKTKRSFSRFFFEYLPSEIDQAIQISDSKIDDALSNPDDFDTNACFSYGRKCAFYKLCFESKYAKLPVDDRLNRFLVDNKIPEIQH